MKMGFFIQNLIFPDLDSCINSINLESQQPESSHFKGAKPPGATDHYSVMPVDDSDFLGLPVMAMKLAPVYVNSWLRVMGL
jgi:hypothetical protein